MKNKNTREHSYQEMKKIGKNPEFSIILNKMRDKCIKRGNFEDIIKIKSKSKKIEKILNSLFRDTLDLKINLKILTKELIQYGEFFSYFKINSENGIYDFMVLPSNEITREEGYENNIDGVKFHWEAIDVYFESWQVAHFRVLENMEKLPYGTPVFNSNGELKGKKKYIAEDIKDALVIGLKQIANIQIYLLNYKKDIDNFSINLN